MMGGEAIELDCRNYEVLTMVQGSLGAPHVTIGEPGACRFCGAADPSAFRTTAHAMPEAFGNKWVTARDECDACNARFGAYDDALVKSMGAVLTVGGVPGKGNKVRQTGRTGGPASIRHDMVDGKRSISMRVSGTPLSDHVGINFATRELIFRTPAGTERFVPARAYKALVKMAVSIMPSSELPNFSKVIAWLRSPDDEALLPNMIVGLSFASIGNSPPVLGAALLKRKPDTPHVPYMLFVTSMGSVCLQIVLASDARDGPWPPEIKGRADISWTSHIGPAGEVQLAYGPPTHLDWRRAELEPPVIEAIVTTTQVDTGQIHMEAVIRKTALAA